MSHHRAPMATNANARKRPVETIDLTGDEQLPFKAPRSSQTDAYSTAQPSQQERDSWVEEEDANDVLYFSQEGGNGMEETEEYEIYGKQTPEVWKTIMPFANKQPRNFTHKDRWYSLLHRDCHRRRICASSERAIKPSISVSFQVLALAILSMSSTIAMRSGCQM